MRYSYLFIKGNRQDKFTSTSAIIISFSFAYASFIIYLASLLFKK